MNPAKFLQRLSYMRAISKAPKQEVFDMVHGRNRDALKGAVTLAHSNREADAVLRGSMLSAVERAKARYYNTDMTKAVADRYQRMLTSGWNKFKRQAAIDAGAAGLGTATGLSYLGVRNAVKNKEQEQPVVLSPRERISQIISNALQAAKDTVNPYVK